MFSKSLFLFVFLFGLSLQAKQEFKSQNQQTRLLELFSTQSCSSCPPAQSFVSRLKSHPDLWKSFIPVVFHVDYWDYLGWKDPYSSPQFTQRQRRYVQQLGLNGGYTPMFVYNNYTSSQFSLQRLKFSPKKVGVLSVTRDKNNYAINFKTPLRYRDDLVIHYAFIGNNISTRVTDGENSGKNLKHDFLVLKKEQTFLRKQTQKPYTYKAQKTIALPRFPGQATKAVVFWVTQGSSQTPIQAVGGLLK